MKRALLKLIGHRYDERFKWGEFYWHPRPSEWKLSLRLTSRYSELDDMLILSPFIFTAYVFLPSKICCKKPNKGDWHGKAYGFYVYTSIRNFFALVLLWGDKIKHIEMPWTYDWYSKEILDDQHNVVYYEDRKMRRNNARELWKKYEEIANKYKKIYDYTYVKKNGEVQRREAEVFIERMTWARRWIPFKKCSSTVLKISFDKEIGEKAGTYEGGVTGCNYKIHDGESPIQALRRMQKEQIFD